MQSEGQAIEQRQESTMRIVCKLIVETCNPLAFIGWVQNSVSNTSVLSTVGECLKVNVLPRFTSATYNGGNRGYPSSCKRITC